MEYGICLLSVVPVRASADDRSEQVTQILFGERLIILDKKDKWFFVQLLQDKYQGWVSVGQIRKISPDENEELSQSVVSVSNDIVQVLYNETREFRMVVSAGSMFYNMTDGRFSLFGDEYTFYGSVQKLETFNPGLVIENALLFLHVPYQWGGKSVFGIDCSGLTQLSYTMAGMNIHRDASQQATQGTLINLIEEAHPADLAFFDNDEGNIIHTGILLPDHTIIHAHEEVRLDKIDHYGIFNTRTNRYSHKLRIIKRMFS